MAERTIPKAARQPPHRRKLFLELFFAIAFFYFAVRALYGVIARNIIPIIAFRYSFPLVCRAFENNAFKVKTTVKRFFPYARYRRRYRNAL